MSYIQQSGVAIETRKRCASEWPLLRHWTAEDTLASACMFVPTTVFIDHAAQQGTRPSTCSPPRNRCRACETVLCATNNTPAPAAARLRNPDQISHSAGTVSRSRGTVSRLYSLQRRLTDLTPSHGDTIHVETLLVSATATFLQKGRVLQVVASLYHLAHLPAVRLSAPLCTLLPGNHDKQSYRLNAALPCFSI